MTHWVQVGVELQEPHWQQSSLGIPWQPQPLAPWSQEKFQLWLYKEEAETCCCVPPEAAVRRALQSLAWALVEMGGEGWAPTALGHS